MPFIKLLTEYRLEYDAGTVAWSDYGSFLSKGSTVKHIPGDGAVEVILSVRASYDSKSPTRSRRLHRHTNS